MTRVRLFPAALAALVLLPVCGCHVSSHKNGANDNVDIGTPFGSMQVKTNNNVNSVSIGITPYPGAMAVKDDGKNDAADVNMSFGSFHVGVKAASFQTSDPQSKVLSFYRHDLARYGDVLECNGPSAVGEPKRTAQGLTCTQDKGAHHGPVDVGSGLELRTGSPQRQHIVSIEPRDGGTRIALVSLELPSHFTSHGRGDSE